MADIGHDALRDRIVDDHEDDRDREVRRFQRVDRGGAVTEDHVRAELHQIGDGCGPVAAAAPALHEAHVAPIGPAQLAKPIEKRRESRPGFPIRLAGPGDETDGRRPATLLRHDAPWPRNGAGSQRQNVPPSHAIPRSPWRS
jgi:hypothetical protein